MEKKVNLFPPFHLSSFLLTYLSTSAIFGEIVGR